MKNKINKKQHVLSPMLTALTLTACILLTPFVSKADVLFIDAENQVITDATKPQRGMKMSEVRKQYGNPLSEHTAPGPYKRLHPPITTWQYEGFSVYFEKQAVLHSVVYKAYVDETEDNGAYYQ